MSRTVNSTPPLRGLALMSMRPAAVDFSALPRRFFRTTFSRFGAVTADEFFDVLVVVAAAADPKVEPLLAAQARQQPRQPDTRQTQ